MHRLSAAAGIASAAVALLTIVAGYLQPPHPLPTDEGALAHVFQLAVAASFGLTLLFLISADWRTPLRVARPLVLVALLLGVAFAGLYLGEYHVWVAR